MRVPVSSSCVHRDRRPDLTVSGAHSPCLFSVFESLLSCSCLLVRRHGSRRSSFRPSPLQVGVGVGRDRRESAGREPLQPAVRREIGSVRGSFKPAIRRELHDAIRGSFKPAVRGKVHLNLALRSREMDAAVRGSSKPAADSSPPACR